MKVVSNFFKLSALFALVLFVACSDDDNEPNMQDTDNIVETAIGNSDLSSLVAALQKADESANNDLVNALSGTGPFTVFAPTNAAFEDLLAQLDGFDSLEDFDSEALQDILATILEYHVVVGTAAQSTDLSDGQVLTTLQGSTITVSTEGGVFLDDATAVNAQVTTANVVTENGVVHVIDKVLLPQSILDELEDIILVSITDLAIGNENLQSLVAALTAANGDLPNVLRGEGPFTVLAPTDAAFAAFLGDNELGDIPVETLTQVLLNHVIAGELFAADLVGLGAGYASTEATGAGDAKMSIFFNTADNDVRFNDVSSVIENGADVKAINGVVHVVDAVIGLPTVVTHAVANPNLSTLVTQLTTGSATDFVSVLSNEEATYTVFAPLNSAFDDFENPNGNVIDDILLNHVISGAAAFSTDLATGYDNTTMAAFAENENISLYINVEDEDGVTFNGVSTVVDGAIDIVATNGVVHAVDAVIDLPTVVTFAVADPTFDSLQAALTTDGQPDFVGILSDDGPYTVFAPTNDAFTALLESNMEWDDLTDIDTALLTSVLQHHVLGGANAGQNIRSGDLVDGISPETLEGDAITINLPGTGDNIADVTDGAGNTDIGIIVVDVQAANGVIHALNKVMLPNTTN